MGTCDTRGHGPPAQWLSLPFYTPEGAWRLSWQPPEVHWGLPRGGDSNGPGVWPVFPPCLADELENPGPTGSSQQGTPRGLRTITELFDTPGRLKNGSRPSEPLPWPRKEAHRSCLRWQVCAQAERKKERERRETIEMATESQREPWAWRTRPCPLSFSFFSGLRLPPASKNPSAAQNAELQLSTRPQSAGVR